MFKSIIAATALAAGAQAKYGPWHYDGMKHGDAIPGEYLVKLRENPARLSSARVAMEDIASKYDINIQMRSKYNAIYGMRGVSAEALADIMANPDVELVTPNQVVSIYGDKPIVDNKPAAEPCVEQRAPSWGLSRVSNGRNWRDGAAMTLPEACGEGVELHILDTGVDGRHIDFANRRFDQGDFTLEGDFDGHGHGTHVASTAGGNGYGFATCSHIVSLKVLSSGGAGNLFSIIGAMEISQESAEAGNKVVSNMSLGALRNEILNGVATGVADAGVVMAVAAGNDNADAFFYSPASAERVWTVGASASDDTRSVFSNFGSTVNIFAPGTDITAACPLPCRRGNGDGECAIEVAQCGQIAGRPGQVCETVNGTEHCYARISGTSMACPHAAGVAAVEWSRNPSLNNFQLQALIESRALVDQLTNVGEGSPNLLLQQPCF